ncbi:MAG TPA: hypothetical protein VGE21_07630 [Flavobacteriales bacterium]
MRIRRMMVALAAAMVVAAPAEGKEYVVPAGQDVGQFFAALPEDATCVVFSAAAEYRSNGDILLPDRQMLIIDGRGCKLLLGTASNGFTRAVIDQKDADRRIANRYVFRDLGSVEGGRKGIDLKATLGSSITDCRFKGQTEAAIDLRFCLMARLQNVLVTAPGALGIVVRQGDWPGASAVNSQSNSTVLEQCRVFCSKTTTNAFTVLNSGGVRMSDCIAEGATAQCDLFLSATMDGDESRMARNPVVKSFTLENFHVEHRTERQSIYVNMPPKATVVLRNVYWNIPLTNPAVRYTMGQLNISDIGWWNPDFRIATRVSAPRINVTRSHNALNTGEKSGHTPQRAGSFVLEEALPDNDRLSLSYIRITEVSM